MNLPYFLISFLLIRYALRQYNKVVVLEYKYKFQAIRDLLVRGALVGDIDQKSKAYTALYGMTTNIMNYADRIDMFTLIMANYRNKKDPDRKMKTDAVMHAVNQDKSVAKLYNQLNVQVLLLIRKRHIISFTIYKLLRKEKEKEKEVQKSVEQNILLVNFVKVGNSKLQYARQHRHIHA